MYKRQRQRLQGLTAAVDTLGSSWPPEYGEESFMFGAQSWVATSLSPWPSSDEEASTPDQFQTGDDVDAFGLPPWPCESDDEASTSAESQTSPWPTASALLSEEPPTSDGVDAFGLSLWPTAASDEVSMPAERTEPEQKQKEQKLAAATSVCSVYSCSEFAMQSLLLLLLLLFLSPPAHVFFY